jgi:orotidine-5'-phosphate decarboxylase
MGRRNPVDVKALKAIRDYGLILAIDSQATDEILGLATKVGPMVDGIKLGVPTLLAQSTSIVRRIRERFDGPLVADLKVADIGVMTKKDKVTWSGTNRAIVEAAISSGIDYVICHTIVGTTSIEECITTAHSLGGKVLTLPYMTHEGAGLFFDHPLDTAFVSEWLNELGMKRVNDVVLALAERKRSEEGWRTRKVTISDLVFLLGEEFQVDGYIAPANRADVQRDYRKLTDRLVLATGVGRQGGALAEVYSALGANSAAIVGHAIYDQPDPVAACKELLAERVHVTGRRQEKL